MLLSELIKDLQSKLDEYGDVKCYTNGEHGSVSSERLTKDHVNLGHAHYEIDQHTADYDTSSGYLENDSELVLNIGGY
tara:strand:- start:564 stop:797 length:234 start_codon:yes stop_codon:yes gene_type:complete